MDVKGRKFGHEIVPYRMKHLTDKSSREMNDREIRAAFALLTRAAAEKDFRRLET